MHLDGALDTAVVRVMQISVAATDVRDDAAVLAGEPLEQLVGGVDRFGRGLALDQDVRRAADRPTLFAIEDVAIAAHAGVARPFVTRQADELARLVEPRGQRVELFP